MANRALLAIDPGLQGTGYAVWDGSATLGHIPRECGVLNARRDENWIKRTDEIAMQVLDLVRAYHIRRIICEMMELHQSSRAMMVWSKGDLQRTLFLIGTIHGYTRKQVRRFDLTPPSEWKGQLPKSVTIHRVRKALGYRVCHHLAIKTHAWDAVGIGLWYQGVIK